VAHGDAPQAANDALHVRMQNQLESLLEEAHIKLSGFVTDLLGVSSRRMLQALAEGETEPAALAALADKRLRATPAELRDALGACTDLNPVYRRLIKMALQELQFLEQQMGQLEQTKGSIFEIVYRRKVTRMGHNQAIGVIAHRLCQLIWILLHRKVRYQERGPAVTETSKRKRTARMIRQLRALGYRVEALNLQTAALT
jgi:hypothetical protein